MRNIINNFLNLDQKDRAMLLLLNITIINIVIAIVKFIFAFTLPSLWFFINAIFMTILSSFPLETMENKDQLN